MFRILTKFFAFQQTFNKRYSSLSEIHYRFTIFNKNMQTIQKHNKDTTQTFRMGINQFTDLEPYEFKAYVGKIAGTKQDCYTFTSDHTITSSWDWRDYNAVTPVKNQEQCGSCWAFSSTGSSEGAWAIKTGDLINLSEQELVDCAGFRYGSNGCNGGQMDGAFKYMIDFGQCSTIEYPYDAVDGECDTCTAVTKFSECYNVNPNDQVSLKAAVALQPVAVAIEADTYYFQSYSSGILTSPACGTTLDHGVLIVGYGTEADIPYWLVKNSWGITWGEEGYVKIAISNISEGICGIAIQPSFIIV